MKQKARQAIIGAFAVGAMLLAAGLIIFFGTGDYFKEKERYVLYFEDSLKGLDVGAPVRLMGVRVGKVTGIDLVFDSKNFSFCTPVYVEVDTNRISLMDYGAEVERSLGSMDEDDFRRELIRRGLRAQLKIDSLLTGMLYVDINFHPDKSYIFNEKNKEVMELPTILSDIAEFSKAMESIPVEAIVDRVVSAVESIDRIIASAEDKHTLENVSGAIEEFKGLMTEAREVIDPMAHAIEGAAQETRKLVARSDEGVAQTLELLEQMALVSQSMMARVEKTLESLEGSFGKESAITYRLQRMIGDVSEASRSMRGLADYIERHPEALVFGKGKR